MNNINHPIERPGYSVNDAVIRQRVRRDNLVRKLVTLSGWLVLLTLGGIIWHLVSQSLPLLLSPQLTLEKRWQLAADQQLQFITQMPSGRIVVSKTPDCHLQFSLATAAELKALESIAFPCNHTQKFARHDGALYLADMDSSGVVRVEQVTLQSHALSRAQGFSLVINSDGGEHSLLNWDISLTERWALITTEDKRGWTAYWINRQNPRQSVERFVGQAKRVVSLAKSSMLLVQYDKRLQLFNHQGQQVQQFTTELAVDALFAAPSHRTFFITHDDGRLDKWSLRSGEEQQQFHRVWQLQFQGKVSAVTVHNNDNTALVTEQEGGVSLINRVTGEVLSRTELPSQITMANWQDDNVLLSDGRLIFGLSVSQQPGAITWQTLWSLLWYEGYEQPDYVWQSSSAADFQQQKFSLVPLLIGSFKASMLALLVAVPLALGAAIYVGYFATPAVRRWLKPAIEMLEAVPSVIVGFIAAVWLTPIATELFWLFIMLVIFTPTVLFVVTLVLPLISQRRTEHGATDRLLWLLAGSFLLLLAGAIYVAPEIFNVIISHTQTHGQSTVGINNTTLVVALALGIAISPSIFTLAEDAISGVPEPLSRASFALGATRQQTLLRVVLLVALPGIVSAVMLGLGRAFGETMIVLMVTGNTPVGEWDLLAGIRALTANLAIELPETKQGSMHYHVLYLTALLLFLFTFVVNTLAELLRGKYRRQLLP